MLSDPSLKTARRPERYLAGRWGIFSEANGTWLDMVFNSEREAKESLAILLKQVPPERRATR